MDGIENAPQIVQWIAQSGLIDFLKEHFSTEQSMIILIVGFVLLLVIAFFLIVVIINLLYKIFGKKEIKNGLIIKSLGRTDEEKYVNILEMKKVKKLISKIIIVISAISGLIFLYGINKGNMDIDIWVLILLYIANYIYMVHILGTGIAWFVHMCKVGDYSMPETESEENTNKEIIRAYIIGGRRYASAVAAGINIGDFIIILIGFIIGYWLGWINAIVHYGECRAVKKRIKEKYKVEKQITN